ncbi:MAG TPA: efflux RND transporter periplasmic adaptor subunit [Acidobacteriaceae bacterium]|jgi:RND family efflux transporter MFP subunit|nr:efflux RND transporter periplasmic adaptor subunit [Acidobacteriaceae bacterium]
MRKRLWVLIAAAAVALVAVLVLTFDHRHSGTVEAAPGPPAAQVALVQRGTIDQVLTLAGQFQPYQVVDVHPKVSGFIRHIYVDIGDRVHQGETLAVLEVPELQAQLAGTVSEVARSKDEIQRAQHEVQRAESTYAALHADYQRLLQTSQAQPGLVAQQELDDAQAKDLSAQAEVDGAKAAQDAASKGLDVSRADNQRVSAIEGYTNVVAPLDGVIVWRYADTGALIQSGVSSNNQDLPIVKLAQSGVMRLRLPVPESYVRYVHMGDHVKVRVDALGRSFQGEVVRFTRELNFETRTMETEVDVPNQDLAIDSGMYANVLMGLNHADNVLTVPVSAIVLQGQQNQVSVLDSGNRVQVRDVDVGIRGNQLAEIKSGLQVGDRVVLAAQAKYPEGEQVTPVVASTPASETAPQSGGVIDMSGDASAASDGGQ